MSAAFSESVSHVTSSLTHVPQSLSYAASSATVILDPGQSCVRTFVVGTFGDVWVHFRLSYWGIV